MNDTGSNQFLKLLMPNQKRIFSYILTLVPNYSNAEDVMQEVAQLLWEKFPEYTPNTDFVAWALAIARYKVLELYKESDRIQQRLSKETIRVLEKEAPKFREDYDAKLGALKKCVIQLDVDDYKLVQLRYEANQKVKIIASRYGCSIYRIYRSLARIHNLLLTCIKSQVLRGDA